jgi:hypothetical protein
MRRVALVVPVLLVAGALVGGCGGGSSLSKSDYVAKAEAVCKDANDKFKALARPSDAASFQSFVEDTLQIAQDATKKLKDLDAPSKDAADIDSKVLEPLEDQLTQGKAYLEKVKKAVKANDQTELGKLLTNPPEGKKADTTWMKSYGFKACVEAASTGR